MFAFLAAGGESLGAVKETCLLLSLTSLPGPSLASPPLTRSFLSLSGSHLSHRDSSHLFTHATVEWGPWLSFKVPIHEKIPT